MKWKDRRQSINLMDLRIAPKKLIVIWESENSDTWNSYAFIGTSSSSTFLGVDGVFYEIGPESDKNPSKAEDFAGSQEIKIVVEDLQYQQTLTLGDEIEGSGTLTTGQQNALRDVVRHVLRFVQKRDISISGSATPEGTMLLGYIQSVLNNN